MKKHLLTAIKFIAFLSLGVFLIWYVLKDLTPEAKEGIKQSLLNANYAWVLLAMGTGLLSHFIRAVRWKMLMEPMQQRPRTSSTFYAVMVGYLGNLAINRLGEVLRCGILKQYENIPFPQSFGTVIAERVIDTLCLLLLFVASITMEYDRMEPYLASNVFLPLSSKFSGILNNPILISLLVLSFLIMAYVLYRFRRKFMTHPIPAKVFALIYKFWEGMQSVRQVRSPLMFIAYTAFIWFLYLLSVYVCVFAMKETSTLSLSDSLLMMCFGSLGVIATPGGIGAYHLIILQILMFWGYSEETGIAFGWLAWLAQVVVVLVFGLISFGLLAAQKRTDPLPEKN